MMAYNILSAQTEIVGNIKDRNNNEPLAYVNIGIVGKNMGTVSNIEGEFSLKIPFTFNEDTMRLSMIGYESKEFIVKDFISQIKENSEIFLSESVTRLKEVVVSGRELKTEVLGNKTTSTMVSAGFESNMLGNEVGIGIKIKKRPTLIKDFNCFIVKNVFGLVKFRLNIYELEKGKPGKSLLNENIIVETDIEQGRLTIDLLEYNIVVEDDFYIGLEWIEDLGDSGLMFSAGFFNKPMIYKETSQAEWNKIGVLGLGFNVTVGY